MKRSRVAGIAAPPRGRKSDGGFTIIEVVIAAFLLALASIAVFGIVQAATRNTYRAEQSQVVVNRLQHEIEWIKQLPYHEVALSALPAASADPDDPGSRVSGSTFAVDREGTTHQPLVISSAGFDPGPETFTSGDVSYSIYRYVVWQDDPSCPASKCPGVQDLKRAIVVIKPDDTAAGGARAYQELQAQIADPNATPVNNPGPGGSGDADSWMFFLTDTSCDHSSRDSVAADHLTHNTFGMCSAEMQTGATAGAPDLMIPQASPIDPEFPELFDLATDVEPTADADTDNGLQMRAPTSNGCPTNISSTASLNALGADPYQRIHKWLAPEIPDGFHVRLDGRGTLNLWTQTINGAVHPGKLCVYLYTQQIVLGLPINGPITNLDQVGNPPYFTYSQGQWPQSSDPDGPEHGWQEIHVPLHFPQVDLTPDVRLGLAILVERGGTLPGAGLQFMYDQPSFESRLELETDSLVPVFN